MVRKQRRFKTPSPKKLVGAFLLVICLLFVLFPLLLMAAASFMPEDELARRYLAVLELGREPVLPALVPDFPSLKPYADLFLRSPGFFVMFWNSCLQVLCVLAGQLLVGMPAAWAFARYDFRFKIIDFSAVSDSSCHAVPGNDGSILSGPGPFQDTGHTSGGYTAWNILHLSCLYHGEIL